MRRLMCLGLCGPRIQGHLYRPSSRHIHDRPAAGVSVDLLKSILTQSPEFDGGGELNCPLKIKRDDITILEELDSTKVPFGAFDIEPGQTYMYQGKVVDVIARSKSGEGEWEVNFRSEKRSLAVPEAKLEFAFPITMEHRTSIWKALTCKGPADNPARQLAAFSRPPANIHLLCDNNCRE